MSVRTGQSAKMAAATKAARWSSVTQKVTAYIAQPESAQTRSRVRLYARIGFPVRKYSGPPMRDGVNSDSAKVRLFPMG